MKDKKKQEIYIQKEEEEEAEETLVPFEKILEKWVTFVQAWPEKQPAQIHFCDMRANGSRVRSVSQSVDRSVGQRM